MVAVVTMAEAVVIAAAVAATSTGRFVYLLLDSPHDQQ
jgi:hypothetical protein